MVRDLRQTPADDKQRQFYFSCHSERSGEIGFFEYVQAHQISGDCKGCRSPRIHTDHIGGRLPQANA